MDSVYRIQSTFSHTPGSVTLTFSSTVAQGLGDEAWGLDNIAVAITPPPNQPPTAHAGRPYAVDEGATASLVGSGSDPEGGALNFAWDLDGNGTFEVAGATTTFSAAGTTVDEGAPISLSLAHASDVAADLPTLEYAFDCSDGAGYGAFGPGASRACPTLDNGPRTVRGKIRDKDGGMTEYTSAVSVRNVAPVVTITGPTAESVYVVNTPVTFSGTFSDAGTGDTHTAQWLLDDTAIAGQVSESNGSGSANLAYVFASPGRLQRQAARRRRRRRRR